MIGCLGGAALGRGRLGLVFRGSGVGLWLQPREVRTLAAMGLAGKCASDPAPALSATSGWDGAAPVGVRPEVEGGQPTRLLSSEVGVESQRSRAELRVRWGGRAEAGSAEIEAGGVKGSGTLSLRLLPTDWPPSSLWAWRDPP